MLHLGCGGTSDGPRDGDEAACRALQFASSSGHPLDEITVEGVPESFSNYLAAKVTAGEDSSITLVSRREDGSIVLIAPIHPRGLTEGGEVTLELIDEDDRSCEPIPFSILPLPAAPGTTEEVFDKLRARVKGQAIYFATSVQYLRTTELEYLPLHLIPLYLAQYSLDDPENPNSLQRLLDGSAPILEGVPADLDLLDGLLSHLGVPEVLSEDLEALQLLLPQQPGPGMSALSGGTASDALDLHLEMEMAQWGGSHQGDSPVAKVTSDISTVVGLGGLIPYPPAKAGAMLLGSSLFAFVQGAEAAAKLLPSKFVSIDFEFSPASFGEDDPSAGHWQKVEVVAKSEGWNLDKAILESLLQFTSVKGGYKGWFDRFGPPEGFREALGGHLKEQGVTKVINAAADDSGIISLPPHTTDPIDVTEEEWSFAKVSFAITEDGRQSYRLDSTWEGSDEGRLTIGTSLGKFGGQHISKAVDIPVLPIQITADPPQAKAEPGQELVFAVEVSLAYDPELSASATTGTATLVSQGGGIYQLRYKAPPSEELLPDLITLQIESTTGMLANPNRRRPTLTIPIQGTNPFIEIDPQDVCVENGESVTFSAEVFNLEDQRVRWEASQGNINQSGRYTASGAAGVVEIRATSLEDETVQAAVSIYTGICSCFSTSSLGGAIESSMISDNTLFNRHADGSLASLTFEGPDHDDGADTLTVNLPPGVFPGDTGTHVAGVTGLYTASGHSFMTIGEGSADTGRLTLTRFDRTTLGGGKDDIYDLEGSFSASIKFGMLSHEPFAPGDYPLGTIQLRFRARYDTHLFGEYVSCSGR